MDAPQAMPPPHSADSGAAARSARNSHSGAQKRTPGYLSVSSGNSPGRTTSALLSPCRQQGIRWKGPSTGSAGERVIRSFEGSGAESLSV